MNGQQNMYMHRHHHHSAVTLIAGLATLAAALAMAVPAASGQDNKTPDQKRASDQNTMKGIGIGAGALGLWEMLHGRGTNALILGAGAAYAGKKYEDDRKANQADEQKREDEQREHERRVGEMKRRESEESGSASSASLPPPSATSFAPIHVFVNNDEVSFPGKGPEMSSGSVYVPMRGVLEKLGAYVEWDAANHSVLARKGDQIVTLPMSGGKATIDGHEMALDTPAYLSSGSTMVPLRFLAQTFGAKVNWNAQDRDVRIVSHASGTSSPG
jgi:hypothetical protein